jgi:hypothetical protein
MSEEAAVTVEQLQKRVAALEAKLEQQIVEWNEDFDRQISRR